MLDGIANEIRHDLGEAVGIPLADQIATLFQPQDGVRVGGVDLEHHLFADVLQVGA